MKFEAKVNYVNIDLNSGREKKFTENYIIADAENWADAETQLYTQMAKITNATITKAIKISDVIDVVKSEGDYWYKAKLEMAVIDEQSGKNKPIKETVLIQADGFKEACEKVQAYTLEIVIPVEVLGVTKSSIVDILDDEFMAPVKFVVIEEGEENEND